MHIFLYIISARKTQKESPKKEDQSNFMRLLNEDANPPQRVGPLPRKSHLTRLNNPLKERHLLWRFPLKRGAR
jgi:hypothetical protein